MSVPLNTKEAVLDPATTDASDRLDANATGERPLWRRRGWKKVLRVLNPIRRRVAPAGHVSFANPPVIIWLTAGQSLDLSWRV
jgi:metal iron transporter